VCGQKNENDYNTVVHVCYEKTNYQEQRQKNERRGGLQEEGAGQSENQGVVYIVSGRCLSICQYSTFWEPKKLFGNAISRRLCMTGAQLENELRRVSLSLHKGIAVVYLIYGLCRVVAFSLDLGGHLISSRAFTLG
jgi:hypothetical protein